MFTQELIKNKRPDTLLLVIEANESFYKTLQSKYGHLEQVHVIHGSAEHVARYMKQYHVSKVDYIVSGLPFTSLPAALSSLILGQTAEVLGQEGKFITFQYSKVKHNFFSYLLWRHPDQKGTLQRPARLCFHLQSVIG